MKTFKQYLSEAIELKGLLDESLRFAQMPVGHPEPVIRPSDEEGWQQEVSQHSDGSRSIITNNSSRNNSLDIHYPRGSTTSVKPKDIMSMFARGLSHAMDYLDRHPKPITFTARTDAHDKLYKRFLRYINSPEGRKHPVHGNYEMGRSPFGPTYTLRKRRGAQ